jgi:hypothetical protein
LRTLGAPFRPYGVSVCARQRSYHCCKEYDPTKERHRDSRHVLLHCALHLWLRLHPFREDCDQQQAYTNGSHRLDLDEMAPNGELPSTEGGSAHVAAGVTNTRSFSSIERVATSARSGVRAVCNLYGWPQASSQFPLVPRTLAGGALRAVSLAIFTARHLVRASMATISLILARREEQPSAALFGAPPDAQRRLDVLR